MLNTATILEIASRALRDPRTVKKVMTGDERVSALARAQIHRAAVELGYAHLLPAGSAAVETEDAA